MSSSRRRRGSVHEDLNAPRIAAQALQEHATDRYNLVRAVVGAIEACDVGRGNAVFCIGTAGCDLLLYEEFVRSGVFLPETAAQATSVSLAIPGLDPSKSYELTTQLHNRKLWVRTKRALRQMGVLMFKDYDTDVNSLDFRVERKNVADVSIYIYTGDDAELAPSLRPLSRTKSAFISLGDALRVWADSVQQLDALYTFALPLVDGRGLSAVNWDHFDLVRRTCVAKSARTGKTLLGQCSVSDCIKRIQARAAPDDRDAFFERMSAVVDELSCSRAHWPIDFARAVASDYGSSHEKHLIRTALDVLDLLERLFSQYTPAVHSDSGADDSEPSFERDPTPPEAPRVNPRLSRPSVHRPSRDHSRPPPPLHPDDFDFDELHLENPASPLYYEDPRPSSRAGPSARYERTLTKQQGRTRPPITKSAPVYRRGSVSFDKRPSSFDYAGSPPYAGPSSDAPRMQSASFRKKPGMADFQTGQTPVRRERRYSLYDQYWTESPFPEHYPAMQTCTAHASNRQESEE